MKMKYVVKRDARRANQGAKLAHVIGEPKTDLLKESAETKHDGIREGSTKILLDGQSVGHQGEVATIGISETVGGNVALDDDFHLPIGHHGSDECMALHLHRDAIVRVEEDRLRVAHQLEEVDRVLPINQVHLGGGILGVQRHVICMTHAFRNMASI